MDYPDPNLPAGSASLVEPIPFKIEPEVPPTPPEGPGPIASNNFQPIVNQPESPLEGASQAIKSFVSAETAGGGAPVFSKLKLLLPILGVLVLLVVIIGVVFKVIIPMFSKGVGGQAALTYWGLWEDDNVFEGVLSDYQKNHPKVKITYQRQSANDYRERLQSALARGDGPDIFRFHNTWVPMLKNELSPVSSKAYDAASFEKIFYPIAQSDLRVGSSYVGIPLEYDGLALFVNNSIFQSAGKIVPKTWDDLRKTASELTVRDSSGQIQIAGVALGRTENIDHWSDILGLMLLQNGADPSRPAGNLVEDALTYFTLFSRVDRDWDQTLPPSTVAFSGGKVAMYFGPSWEVFEIKRANPSLDFSTVPVPQLPETNLTWASYWVEGVSKKSKNSDAAWDFLKYLSSKEVLQKLYDGESKLRLFGEPYSRIDMADQLTGQPYVGAYIQQAPNARSWYLSSRTFDNGINDKIIKYYEDAINTINQGKTAKEALVLTAQGVAQVLGQYGLGASVVR
ncbi:MAG: extracellular solute-binding protein [bacterium]|nr:extracellular solute-binding protein [bacterium]